MMNPMQLIQMLNQSNNPTGMMQGMFNNNPLMQRALEMGKGKSEEEMKQIVMNMAQTRGMNQEQLANFLMQFGLKL